VRFLTHDRDAKFCGPFDEVLGSEGMRIIRTPIRSPQANAFAERLVKTLRHEVLDWTLILGRRHLDRVLASYASPTTPSGLTAASRCEYRTSRATSTRWRSCQRSNGVISSAA
jgi:transposase InsO family protein